MLQFLHLCQGLEGGIHYATVAQQFGISKVTAYEMLRLLEKRGLVQASYQVNPAPRRSGRLPVLFAPTAHARSWLQTWTMGTAEWQDRQTIREHLLLQLREGEWKGYESLLTELTAIIAQACPPLVFLAQSSP